jgi:type I restriction enzyme, S subunit
MEVKLGYKQTEVGIIPEDWRASTIGADADLLTGFPFPSEGFVASGVRLLRGSNVKRGVLDWRDDITEYWPSITPDIQKYKLQDGDVIIAMDGALVGRSYAVVAAGDLPALLVQRVARIRSRAVDLRLLGAWIGSERFVRHVDSVKTHTAIPHISPRDIREFAISLPTEGNEQRAIAEALSDVNTLLDGLDRLITKKSDLKQAALQQLLTGQTRLPGFHGEWEVVSMRNVLVQNATYGIVTAGAFVGNGVKMIRSGDIVDGCINTDLPMVTREKAEEYSRTRLLRDDVVIALVGYPGASARILDELIGANISRAVGLLRTNKKIAADYLVCFLNSPDGRRMVLAPSAGSAQQVVNLAALNKLEFRIPSLAEQTAIAVVLSDLDAELKALEARYTKTCHLKQAMMQELLTGKTRLVPAGACHA